MDDVGSEIDMIYFENAFCHTFSQDATQCVKLFEVKLSSHAFYFVDVAEELCAKRAIALHHIFDEMKVGVMIFTISPVD